MNVHLLDSVGRNLAHHNMMTTAADPRTTPAHQNHVPYLIIIKKYNKNIIKMLICANKIYINKN